jgi:hypothetical protein
MYACMHAAGGKGSEKRAKRSNGIERQFMENGV